MDLSQRSPEGGGEGAGAVCGEIDIRGSFDLELDLDPLASGSICGYTRGI